MFAQHSRSSNTYTHYREAESSDQAAGDGKAAAPAAANQPSPSQQLLQEVLGETLVRNREHPGQLVQVLRALHGQYADHECDEALFTLIAREVLRHRLGPRSSKLPKDLYDEVGRALWTNENSRGRVQRFWDSLGAET